jgi:Tfp pilus assembly protein PilZ
VDAPRKHPRLDVRATVRLRVAEGEYACKSRNMSRGGLCIDVDERVEPGQEGLVDIVLSDNAAPLTLAVRVVWCTAIGSNHQVGAQFGPMQPEQARTLESYLRVLN